MVKRNIFLLFASIFLITSLLSCDSQPTQPGLNGNNGGNGDSDNGDEPFSHTLSPGASNEAFLLENRFDELVIETQYMGNHRPTDDALNELVSFFESHLNKNSITILEPEEIPSGGQSVYSATDIRNLEEEHRRNFSEANSLVAYNLFVDGKYTQENVIGIAYYNTSTAYFGETIDEITGMPPLNPSREKIESIVLRHEFGHLFGLVDNGTEMQEDHQENGPHCTEQECVMYHTVNTADFFGNLFDGSVPDLDAFCAQDISALRGN